MKRLGQRVVPEPRLLDLDRVGVADAVSLRAVWHGELLQQSNTVSLDELCIFCAPIELRMSR
jgi:hypothetical protein